MKYEPIFLSSKLYLIKNSLQVKIFHLSDLLINSNDSHNGLAYKKLIVQIKNTLFDNRIDYLIINGNITSDGTTKSFEKAFKVINNLAYRLLKSENENGKETILLSRIIIVPGRNDIHNYEIGEDDYEKFNFFWKKFYSSRVFKEVFFKMNNSSDFYNTNIHFRDLVDLTLLTIPYWVLLNKNISFEDTLKQIRLADHIEYNNATPTILIAQDLEQSLNNNSKARNASFFRKINTTLQLIGSAGALTLPRGNSSIKHMLIGTGEPSKQEPLKALMIYLRPYSSNKPRLRIDHWNYQRKIQVWKRETRFNGQQDQWLPQYQSKIQVKPVFDQQIQKMLNEFETKKVVAVKGFPGSGKCEFFEYLKSNLPDCLYIDLPYDIIDAVDKFKALLVENKKSNKTVLLVRDPHFHERDYETQEDHIRNFRNALSMLAKHSRGVLYFYSSLGSEKNDKLFRKIQSKFGSIRVNRLAHASFGQMFAQYSKFIPVNPLFIQQLSGSFAGFSRLLLNGVLENYIEEVSNHKVVDEDYCNALVAKAIEKNNDLITENNIFREAIVGVFGGNILLKLIDESIKEKIIKLNGNKDDHNSLNWLKYLFQDLKIELNLNNIKSPEQKRKAKLAIDYLQEDSLFTQSQADENIYYLNVIVPFLIKQSKPTFQEIEF